MLKLSKSRIQLLRLFYTNPGQAFFIQELGRILGHKPGVFQRTLYNMEKEGILLSEYKANARYFQANKDFPLFEEYKSIVFKTIGVIGSVKEILDKSGQINFSFLYGSFAKNKENSLSDIDLLIIGSPDENKLIRDLGQVEINLKREINYKLFSLNDFLVSIRNKDPFLLGILKEQKIMLIGGEDELRTIVEGSSHKETSPGPRSNQAPIGKGRKGFINR